MPDENKAKDRVLAVLVMITSIAVVAFNLFAAAGLVNGITPAVVSERNPSLLTPAGYAFSIWGLIYVGLIAFAIYQLLPAKAARLARLRPLYLASCVLNVAWIWCWHHGMIGLCMLLIVALAAILILLLRRVEVSSLFESAIVRSPLALYAGWVTCAALVNINILLSQFIVSSGILLLIAIASIAIAAAISLLVVWKLGDHIFPLAGAWALTAIAVKQSGHTAIVIACAFAAVACLIAAGSVVTKLKDSTSEG
jgi:hypothetical protein